MTGTGRVLVLAGRVYTGFPGPVFTPGAVLIEGSSIVAVGRPSDLATGAGTGERAEGDAEGTGRPVPRPADGAPAPLVSLAGGARAGTVVLDLGGAVVLPGFVDAHVHLALDAGPDAPGAITGTSADGLVRRMRRNASALLSAGVTTARDLGSPQGLGVVLRDASTGHPSPPAAMAAAPDQACPAGPHLVVSGAPITSPGGHLAFFGGGAADERAVAALVRAQAGQGVNWIKVVLTGGEITPGSDPRRAEVSPELARVAVEAAHAAGLPVAVHAHTAEAADFAIAAGARTVEHCTLLGRTPPRLDAPPGGRTWICPTANSRRLAGSPEAAERHRARLAAIRAAGGRLIAGTDAGIPGVAFERYSDGLVALVRMGVPPDEVLGAATTAAAEALGLPDRGVLAPGRLADLVALESDPLADITATDRVTAVMRAGRLVRTAPGLTAVGRPPAGAWLNVVRCCDLSENIRRADQESCGDMSHSSMFAPMNLSDSLAASEDGLVVAPVTRRSAVDQVIAQLRQAILEGGLATGTNLPSEAKLAASFGVSRPVIREALGSLRALGLVTSNVGKGWQVVSNSIGSSLLLANAYRSEHLYEVRRHLEVPAAGYAALRHADADIEALREVLLTEQDADNPAGAVRLDAQFHVGIARCSGNPLLVSLIECIRTGLEEQSLALSTLPGRSRRAVEEHFAILEAIAARDAEAAEAAMRDHLGAVSSAMCSLGAADGEGPTTEATTTATTTTAATADEDTADEDTADEDTARATTEGATTQ